MNKIPIHQQDAVHSKIKNTRNGSDSRFLVIAGIKGQKSHNIVQATLGVFENVPDKRSQNDDLTVLVFERLEALQESVVDDESNSPAGCRFM